MREEEEEEKEKGSAGSLSLRLLPAAPPSPGQGGWNSGVITEIISPTYDHPHRAQALC